MTARQEAGLWKRARRDLVVPGGYDHPLWFFGAGGKNALPRWSGFTLAYRIVAPYLASGRKPAKAVTTDAETVYTPYLRGPSSGLTRAIDVYADASRNAKTRCFEQRRSALVVVGEAVVGEQVPVARVEEQLGAVVRLDELPRRGQILLGPLVVLHHVDLDRDARRPGAVAELGGRQCCREQQRSLAARARLGQQLRGHDAEREAGIHELVRQSFRREPAALEDRPRSRPVSRSRRPRRGRRTCCRRRGRGRERRARRRGAHRRTREIPGSGPGRDGRAGSRSYWHFYHGRRSRNVCLSCAVHFRGRCRARPATPAGPRRRG